VALRLTVLGCDGSYAGPGGACTGYLLRTDTTTVWLDCGTGTLGPLQEHVSLLDLDAVVVTHEHPDHCLELPVLRNALKYILEVEGLRVVTTAGTRDLIEHISGGAEPTFAWEVVGDGDRATVGDLSFAFARTDHPVETLAVRAECGGRVLAYTSDTSARFSFAAFAAPLHLALCEASLSPDDAGRAHHMTAPEAGEVAREAGAERLLLTHLVPGSDPDRRLAEAATTFDGQVLLAAPGDTHEV
jgi:ribonuclease BN (tRNA processing enzyme)